MNIVFWNCQDLRPKRKELQNYSLQNLIDIPALNETFLTVLGAFVLTLNWEPAAFFCKSDADLADQVTRPSKSLPERSNWQFSVIRKKLKHLFKLLLMLLVYCCPTSS